MDDDYNDSQDSLIEGNRINEESIDSGGDVPKDYPDGFGSYDENYDDEDGNNGRNGRGNRNNNFRGRGRGPPPGWMSGPPPMRFRGRGYGPGGPPMRGRGFFRGRGGPRGFGPNNGPNFDGNWGPMGPPPPGMMGPPPFGPPPGMMGPGGPMGPPPNMMGQPPPFGGPPGMPPNMIANMPGPEFWVETKAEDGKSYYYHSRTRETTWTRPQESPTCKIISQAEMEAMATTGQMPGMGGSQMPMGGPPMGAMQGPPMGMMPPGVAPPSSGAPPFMQPPPWANKPDDSDPNQIPSLFSKEAMPPFMQPPPWVNDGPSNAENEQQDIGSPNDGDEAPPGENVPPMSQPPNGFPGQPGPGGPPGGPPGAGGGPDSGWGGFPPGWPRPLSQPPPIRPPQQGSQMNMPPGQPPQLGIPTSQPQLGVPTSQPQLMPNNPPINLNQPPMNLGQPPMNLGQPPMNLGQPPMNLGQPPMGMGQPPMGLGQPPMGMGQPPMGMGQPPMGMGQPPMGMGQPPMGLGGGQPLLGLPGMPPMNVPEPKADDGKEDRRIPAELLAAAGEWTSHRAPDGRTYYYHARRHESVWDKPQPLRDIDELQQQFAAEKAEAENAENKPEKMDVAEIVKPEVIEIEPHPQIEAAKEFRPSEDKQRPDDKSDKDDKDKSNSRPMWSIHVPGTPWRVVWTAEGRVFFFNPSIPKSVWARPPELVNRDDVDKIISDPPKPVLKLQASNAAAASKAAANGELKRSADSDSDDSEEEPPKKPKVEEVAVKKPTPASIDAGKDAAMEAEVRAARERAIVPLEQRMKTFRQMLLENEVSAFSTWKKELHKIVFDKRYLLLTSDHRKQVFSKYMRERAEEERKEKMNRIQQKRNAFVALMEEAKLHSKSSLIEFSSKYGKDERFKGIDKPRNREQYFTEYLAELKKKEKDEREKKREQIKSDFIALLKEKSIDRHARWSDAKKKVDSDPRYKAVDSSTMREDYFRDYCKIVKDERKKEKDSKEKDRDRSSKKDRKDKERDKDRDKDKDKKDKKSKKEKGSDLDTSAEPEPEAEEDEDSDSSATREREARAQASIKEREREVQRALATSLRDRDKEREYHKRDEAVQHFNALLADLVRNADLTWREAKKQLKKDHRYSLAELLSKDDKERLFTQHTHTLAGKRRDKLRALLDELSIPLAAQWRDVRREVREHAKPHYENSEKMEREFRDYQRDRLSAAKTAFRQLLVETRSLSHRSLASVAETTIQPVLNELKHDARFLALDHVSEDRETIIMSYLKELETKGPPPPPTATEPSRRSKQ